MARPAPDGDKIRRQMLDLAEAQLRDSGGRRLILSDIAAQMGMSQSGAHRFFATKGDLVRALAARWFKEVEDAVADAAAQADTPKARIEAILLTTLRLKRARFDADPALFRAYLTLAGDHSDVVARHTQTLAGYTRREWARLVAPDAVDAAMQVYEDATVAFRTPAMIAARRDCATEERAKAVLMAVFAALG